MAVSDPVIELDNAIAMARLLADEIGGPPPLVQGRYELLKTLGHGAHGLVCEALDRHLRRAVALKLMPLQGPRSVEYAVREAQTLAQFDHPNIVHIFDVGQANEVAGRQVDLVFVVMELLKGTNLRRWAAAGPHLDAVREVFLAAGEGLAAAHARGFVHGDFKPENVVIDERGHVRVVDFGLARLHGGDVAGGEFPGAAKTMTQGPRGTPGYIAPEVFQSRIDARSDQYSFAVSLWEIAAAGMPTPGERERSLAALPTGLARLIRRACAEEPAARFPSMRELLTELRALDLNAEPSVIPPRPSQPWWTHPIVMLMAAVVALGGLAAYVAPSGPGQPEAAKTSPAQPRAAGSAPSDCPELAAIAGDWSFTTVVEWSAGDQYADARGFYWLEVKPQAGCQALFLVRKHGDSGLPNYKNLWQDRVTASVFRVDGATKVELDTWLGKNRPLDGSDTRRDGLHYVYSLRWRDGRLEGDWQMTDGAAPVMRGRLNGVRGTTNG